MIRLSNIKIRANLEDREIIDLALKKYNIKPHEIKGAYIFKRSIDARNKKDIYCSFWALRIPSDIYGTAKRRICH